MTTIEVASATLERWDDLASLLGRVLGPGVTL